MRTTDDLNPPEPWRPLGHPEPKPAPPARPAAPPRGDYGIVTDKDGRLSTTTVPKEKP